MPRNVAPCTAPSKLAPRKASECTTPGLPLPRNAGLRTSCHAHAPRKSGKCTGHARTSRPPLVQRPAFLGISCRKLVHRAAFLGVRAGRRRRRGTACGFSRRPLQKVGTARGVSRHGAVGHLGGNARRAAILGMSADRHHRRGTARGFSRRLNRLSAAHTAHTFINGQLRKSYYLDALGLPASIWLINTHFTTLSTISSVFCRFKPQAVVP